MKKILSLVAIALFSVASYAQIGSTTSRSVTTTTVAETKTEVLSEKFFLSRLQLGANVQSYSWQNGTDWNGGMHLGYLANFRILKTSPLYAYGGLNWEFDTDDCRTHMDFEIPFGVNYRIRFGSSKIYFTPQVGFHLKANVMWYDDDQEESFLDYDEAAAAQFGGQVGFNFDLNKFFWGFEYNFDFNPAYKYEDISRCTTGGVRIKLGFVF